MQKILSFRRMAEAAGEMHSQVFDYINEGQIESFESFETFDLLAFDWYDVHSERTETSKVLIYLDQEDVFFFCEDAPVEERIQALIGEAVRTDAYGNDQMLYRFFSQLCRGDMVCLDELETQINDSEDDLLAGREKDALQRIFRWRRELLRLKRYYEQLDTIFDELAANDNQLLTRGVQSRMAVLGNRMDRYLGNVRALQDTVAQLREAYQSQLAIQQNDLMKIFTLVTVIFLPLTLVVGWYGMNFVNMPELHWQYGYPVIIGVCVLVAAGLIWYFKHRKWL